MRTAVLSLTLSLASTLLPAQTADVPLANWTVPPYHASSASGGLTTMADVTPGVGFVGIQPCRVADTRGLGAPITGGIFANSEARNWLITGKCGIPAGADAISANFSVVSPAGTPTGAFLLAWPTGQPAPPTAVMTYGPGVTVISNAAVVPLNGSGQMTVNVSHSTHVILDVNGYFTDQYNPGVSFHAVSSNVAPAILGENTSTAATAVAIQGVITSTGPTGFATGVRGINNGDGYGVFGSSASGFGVVASVAGTGGNAAVWARTTSTGSNTAGVYGSATYSNLAVQNYGVLGETASKAANSAGVAGRDGGGPLPGIQSSAGVRGEGRTTVGVLGLTIDDEAGSFTLSHGVRGEVINPVTGVQVVAGILGYNGNNTSATNYGVYSEGPYGGTGAKFFIEPHPSDPSKVIRYVSLEGNESGTYFRGRGKFQNGLARIEVPEDFRLVTDPDGLTVQVTPIGELATVAVVRMNLTEIVVKSSRNVEFSYTVNGVRRTHKHLTPIGPGHEYAPDGPDAKMPLWLTEGQKEMLISNGTYRPDGTVNMETARRLGWDKQWEKRNPPVALPAPE